MRKIIIGTVAILACFVAPHVLAQTYEKTACPAMITQDQPIDCGTLTVPENRATTTGRVVKLPVMILRSRSKTPAPDPVIFLPGGPGGTAMPRRKPNLDDNPFLDDRDYIVMEPRGAKMSLPALECPGINAIKGEIAAGHHRHDADTALTKAAASCRAALTKQGIDLNGYTSAQTADDIDDLRQALGIKSWNVFGHSYGTRLALTVLRDHPDGVRSVILDSVLPPDVNFDESASANLIRALHVVFDNCAVTPMCRAAYPRLPQDFAALIAKANKQPLQVTPAIMGSDDKPVVIGGAEVVDAVYSALHDTRGIGKIPALIEDSLHGKTDTLAALVKGNQGPSGFTWGLRLSVWCGEEMPYEDPAAVENQTSAAWGLGGIDERTASVAMCKAWNVAPASSREALPVSSDVPVLILSGEFDPDTPPDWGRGLISLMPNAHVVLFAGQSHGAGFNRCGAQIETAFLRDPKAPVAADCALNMRGAAFGAAARPAD